MSLTHIAGLLRGGSVARIALLAALAWAPASVSAAPGDLDERFSRDGKKVIGFPDATVFGAPAFLGLTPGGGSVMATSINHCRDRGLDSLRCDKRGYFNRKQDLALTRLTRGGRRDPSFSGDGRLILRHPDTQFIEGVAVQKDGRIIIASSSGNDILLVRVTSAGKLDRSFSEDGYVVLDSGLRDLSAGVEVDQQGRIVAAGTFGREAGSAGDPAEADFAAARLTPAGTLDPTFSGDGIATADFRPPDSPAASSYSEAADLSLRPDGGVVVAGWATVVDGPEFSQGLGLAAFTSGGEPDTAFGPSGTTPVNGYPAGAVAVDPAGSILTATETGDGMSNFLVSRFDPSGEPDDSFAADGSALIDGGSDRDLTDALTIQPDGKPLIAGSTRGARESIDYALARLTTDGTADRTFSEDGKLVVDFTEEYDDADDVELQGDGKILVSGTVGKHRIGITRHEVAAGPPDFDADGVRDRDDRCPDRYGTRRTGCPTRPPGVAGERN